MTVLGSQLGPFEQQLQIQMRELIPTSGPGQKFSVALSGGADSTALLVAASRVLGAPMCGHCTQTMGYRAHPWNGQNTANVCVSGWAWSLW